MRRIEGKAHLMIRVRDTGIGIEPDFLAHIFKPFRQESTEITKNYGGSGLGMAISDQLINLMGGHIIIDSTVGKGSDFSVYIDLPIAEGSQIMPWEEQQSAVLGEAQMEATHGYTFQGKRVLMAEDNEINAQIAQVMLEKKGATIIRAVDGRDVVEQFNNSDMNEFDIVLMDI